MVLLHSDYGCDPIQKVTSRTVLMVGSKPGLIPAQTYFVSYLEKEVKAWKVAGLRCWYGLSMASEIGLHLEAGG